mmetsp:Transcript_75773/g.202866  ORF Transcript_75773/g.202866 Transcript_75773/m.202866 type:complete len:202 (-) Transcript_75773:1238-1843(-)
MHTSRYPADWAASWAGSSQFLTRSTSTSSDQRHCRQLVTSATSRNTMEARQMSSSLEESWLYDRTIFSVARSTDLTLGHSTARSRPGSPWISAQGVYATEPPSGPRATGNMPRDSAAHARTLSKRIGCSTCAWKKSWSRLSAGCRACDDRMLVRTDLADDAAERVSCGTLGAWLDCTLRASSLRPSSSCGDPPSTAPHTLS